MTQPEQLIPGSAARHKPLWPAAAVILLVVFAPAMLAFVVMLLRH